MYRVLIVDDDKIIRQHIKSIINWTSLGFDIPQETVNGKTALEYIKKNHFDLVITDIYMPVMDGVELIKNAKAIKKDLFFLVISNYDDFKYVKDAMKYGALDYILKYEIEKENLTQLILSIKGRLNITKNSFKEIMDVWKSFFISKITLEQFKKKIETLGITTIYKHYSLLAVKRDIPVDMEDTDDIFKSDIDVCTHIQIDSKLYVVLIMSQEISSLKFRAACISCAGQLFSINSQNNPSGNITIVVSEPCSSVKQLKQQYIKSSTLAEYGFYREKSSIIYCDTESGFKSDCSQMYVLCKNIEECISSENENTLNSILHQLFKNIKENKYFPELVYEHIHNLIVILYSKMNYNTYNHHNSDTKNILYDKIKHNTTVSQLETYISKIITDIHKQYMSVKYISRTGQKINRKEICCALDYIYKNYMHELPLDEVSLFTGLSKNYFCRLFREETGEGFIEYVNMLRIEKSKYLLLNGRIGIDEVAQKVGIGGYRYFYNLFKKTTGLSPSEYRRKET